VAALSARHGLDVAQAEQLALLLEGLTEEDDPHTTVSDPTRAVDVHLADSLSGLTVSALAGAGAIADVGAGAGFPGLPLAVALPGARVDLVESAGRKCAVIARLAERARVANARVLHTRAEELAAGEGRGAYGAVTARAVAPLAVLAEYAAPLLAPGGVLVAWKGRRDEAEEAAGARAAAQLGMEVAEVLHVTSYAGARDHHLHVLRRTGPTPPRFPRRPGQARKRPLD
jgi:16S rRNA (guanine527-N7)-methyltransferase